MQLCSASTTSITPITTNPHRRLFLSEQGVQPFVKIELSRPVLGVSHHQQQDEDPPQGQEGYQDNDNVTRSKEYG